MCLFFFFSLRSHTLYYRQVLRYSFSLKLHTIDTKPSSLRLHDWSRPKPKIGLLILWDIDSQ
jgi:hypothetical protein